MKTYIILIACLLYACAKVPLYAQDGKDGIMFRVYEDNDLFNDLGKVTDEAYSNGTRIDVFYTKRSTPKFFLDRWMPKAGDGSINTYGLGIMQVMYTPREITDIYYQRNDYAWAGALYGTHTLYAYNPKKKYDFQTEIQAGVMGPAALTKPAQITIHHLIKDPSIPQGWSNQLSNNPILNVNFTTEKELIHHKDFLEIIGSAQISAGTMTDALDLSGILLIGIMNPYFNGFQGQFISTGTGSRHNGKLHMYLKLKPGVQFVAWNSLLEGGMFNRNYPVSVPVWASNLDNTLSSQSIQGKYGDIEHIVPYLSYSFVMAFKRFSVSYTQTCNSELVKGTYAHTYGNVTTTILFERCQKQVYE